MVSVHVVAVSVTTVFKIVFAVVCGIFLSPYLSDPTRSEKGFSFIAVRILLPCMLFGNLCLDISFEFLSHYYWAIVMSFIPMLLGALASFLCFRFVGREFRVLIMLGSTFQNGLAFPLSVVTNIRGIAWLDERAVTECQQYVFMYNLSCALCLWSIGGPMVKHFKDKLVAEQEEAEEEAYYERRRHRTLHRFQRELRDRARRRSSHSDDSPTSRHSLPGSGAEVSATVAGVRETRREKGTDTQRGAREAVEAGHSSGDVSAAATAAFVTEIRSVPREDGVKCSHRMMETIEVNVNGEGPKVVSPTERERATSAPVVTIEQTAEATTAATATTAAVEAAEPDEDSVEPDDIIAQYRKFFAPQPPKGVVFPQLEGPSATGAAATSVPTAATTAAKTAVTGIAEAARKAQNWHPGPPPPPLAASSLAEALLDENAIPTVQGQLRWYRPAKRRARPIDVAKFNRWKQRAERARGQGAAQVPHCNARARSSSPIRTTSSSASRRWRFHNAADDAFHDALARGHVPLPAALESLADDMLFNDGGMRGGALDDTGLVAYPPALGEGIYSDNTANLALDEANAVTEAGKSRDKGKNKKPVAFEATSDNIHGQANGLSSRADATTAIVIIDPEEAERRALVEAVTYSGFPTLAISPPSTPLPAEGDGSVFVQNRDNPWAYRRRKLREFLLFAVQTPPIYITCLAVMVSTVPPLRWCAETYVGLSAIKGIALVGTACVPFQLVALGCTLAQKKEEATPLVLQDAFLSESEDSTSDSDSNDSERRKRKEQQQQQQQQQRKQPRQRNVLLAAAGQLLGGAVVGDGSGSGSKNRTGNSTNSSGGSDVNGNRKTARTRVHPDALLTAEPIFDVEETFAATAAAREAEKATAAYRSGLTITANDDNDGSSRRAAAASAVGLISPLSPVRVGRVSMRATRRRLRNAAMRHRREMVAAMGAVRAFWHRIPDATRFTYIVLLLRLVVLPALAFLIVHYLIQFRVMPLDRSFIVSILIGVSSPAAVNASLVCTINDYHAGEFSRMIFIMYCMAAVTSTFWLAASISYTSSFIPEVVRPSQPEDW